MEHVRRTERLAAITQMLVSRPNQCIALGTFCEMFGAAKSTISEDLDLIRASLERFEGGRLETLPGAAGGVRYRPFVARAKGLEQVAALCGRLGRPGRVLHGGLLYIADIIADPEAMGAMGDILASEFYDAGADFVLTRETQGIPLALMTARALNIHMVIAGHAGKVYDGPAVHISYLSGAEYKSLSLPRQAARPGQRALLVDDVLRSGSTALGMLELMREFSVEVVGTAMLVGTGEAVSRLARVKPLMILEGVDGDVARLRPGDWLNG